MTELKAFLGLLNYYSQFLPNLSNTLQALYELLQRKTVEMDKETRGGIQCSKEQVITVWFSYAL